MSPTTRTIIAIARDSALLRSLAFALEAHGHRVEAFGSWGSARSSARDAGCVILDGSIPPVDREDCLGVLAQGVGVVLLAEDNAPISERNGLRVLHKPLSGPDVLEAVASLRRNP